jgi:hypothetical protein
LTTYTLPFGFRVWSLQGEYDMKQYANSNYVLGLVVPPSILNNINSTGSKQEFWIIDVDCKFLGCRINEY